jgi:hypothetical protein
MDAVYLIKSVALKAVACIWIDSTVEGVEVL